MQGLPAPGAKRHRAAIEGDLIRGLDVAGELRLDLLLRDRRRQQDTTSRRRAGELADGDIGRTRQRRGLLHCRAAAIGKHKTAVAAVLGDPIGKRKGEHDAGAWFCALRRRRGRRHLRGPAARKVAGAGCALRSVAAELIEPVIEIDAVAAKPALGEDRGDFGRSLARTQTIGIHDHARQPRRQRQRTQTLALGGDAAVGVERVEFLQQALRLLQRRSAAADRETTASPDRSRPIARGRAPARTDRRTGFPAGCRRRATPSAARPTAGSRRRARCGRHGPAAGPPPRARRARSRAVSGRCRAHSAAPAASPESTTMRTPSIVSDVSAIEVASTTLRHPFGAGAMARSCTAASSAPNSGTISVPASLHALVEKILRAADFGRARQERQHRAGIGAQRVRNGIRHLPLQRHVRLAAEIARLDREGAALALDDRRIAKQPRHPRAVERRRHHQQAQILAQARLRVARQRQPHIGIERALMKLVEQHGGDAVTVRDHRESGGRRCLR